MKKPEFNLQAFSKTPKESCWEWGGSKTFTGYGRVWIDGKHVYAHRLAWELTNGEIPKGMHICHRCDNPPCCNPEHLFLGTDADNTTDKMQKGRYKKGTVVRGQSHKLAKLSENDVRAIRAAYRPGKGGGDFGSKPLAKKYGVAHSLVWRIIKRKSWPHVI